MLSQVLWRTVCTRVWEISRKMLAECENRVENRYSRNFRRNRKKERGREWTASGVEWLVNVRGGAVSIFLIFFYISSLSLTSRAYFLPHTLSSSRPLALLSKQLPGSSERQRRTKEDFLRSSLSSFSFVLSGLRAAVVYNQKIAVKRLEAWKSYGTKRQGKRDEEGRKSRKS